MQKAGYAARLIATAAAAMFGLAASIAAAGELPMDRIASMLRAAGVTSAWAVTQWPSNQVPEFWGVEAYSGKTEPTPGLCATQYTQIGVSGHDGRFVLEEKGTPRTQYAFDGCELSFAGDFHDVEGKFDPAHLKAEFATLMAVVNGNEGKAKIGFEEERFRKSFAGLRQTNITDIDARVDGHLVICFITDRRDQLGAIETLAVELVSAEPVEVKVDLCGYIDVIPNRK